MRPFFVWSGLLWGFVTANVADEPETREFRAAIIEYSTTASPVFIPPTLWGRDERSSLWGGAKRRVGLSPHPPKQPPPVTSFAPLSMCPPSPRHK